MPKAMLAWLESPAMQESLASTPLLLPLLLLLRLPVRV